MALYPNCSPRDYFLNISFYRAEESPVIKTILLSILSTLAVLAIGGNSLAIFVVYRTRSLHNPSGILLAGLASIDLAVGIVGILTSVMYHWLDGYIISETTCIIRGYLITTLIGLSYITVAVIALDRCFAIRRPLHYQVYVTNRRVFQAFIVTTIMASSSAALPLTGLQDQGLGQFEYVHYISSCWLDITNHPKNIVMSIFISIMVIAILMVVIIVYIVILVEAQHIDRKFVLLKSSLNERRQWLRKSTRTTLLLIGAFLICTIPSSAFTLLAIIHCKPIASPLTYKILIHWGIYFNTTINPFLFGFTHKDFRQGYRHVFSRFSLLGTRVSHVHFNQ
ncbi:uncharacterized protein TRIADDRAFT_58724 [Trichoplax adhaerens]|uniref:G-protein coupled receptors family 1 profile domain-containing protein n=1 Tax=Trichoplax adhaerens TaxID=10228 RepID=B3S3H6_TRIAD|nr:hypothetical protein TRIADDRAFT_58724 [Trichoplax adhaerens]EDV22793.1 hypothetical protein TRIADDRAFT_58724 [Trichoplax adhaerens]|eukprot:XP_002114659.1 hypothetical protein TRIADDRAFT_58724 [Trichoplax adhaerens]